MAKGTKGWCMAKAKKTKPRDRLVRWRVTLITKTPAKAAKTSRKAIDAKRGHSHPQCVSPEQPAPKALALRGSGRSRLLLGRLGSHFDPTLADQLFRLRA
jgi:hypothetical protein